MADDDQTQSTDAPVGHEPNADAGGRAHTKLDEPHPAGTGERTDREVGGPKPADEDVPGS